jgi:hypothetical protein
MVLIVGVLGCNSAAPIVTPPTPPTVTRPVVAPPKHPAGAVGKCSPAPVVAGIEARDQPAAIAGCPDVLELSRGNGMGDSRGQPAVTPTVMPPWDNAAARDYACAYACSSSGTASLLAWSVFEDDRPLRNHYAAYLVDDSAKWTVVVMYRHAFNAWWNIYTSFHSRARPVQTFDHKPSADEIDAVLDNNAWKRADDGGFKLLAGNVIEETWPGTPQHKFPAGIEQ